MSVPPHEDASGRGEQTIACNPARHRDYSLVRAFSGAKRVVEAARRPANSSCSRLRQIARKFLCQTIWKVKQIVVGLVLANVFGSELIGRSVKVPGELRRHNGCMHISCGASSCAVAALRASSGVVRSSRPILLPLWTQPRCKVLPVVEWPESVAFVYAS